MPILFFIILGFAGVYAQSTPLEANGRLRVCGQNLCNDSDYPIQLRGMSTHGLQWYPYGDCLNQNSLDALANDWGADVLRISNYIQEDGWVTDKSGFNEMVDKLVEDAENRGMYAIIDFHMLSPGDPNENMENSKEFFEYMAAKHGGKKHVLFEICNEPNGDNVTWSRIKTYADEIIPLIRNHAPEAVILVGTPGWSSFGISGGGEWRDIADNQLSDPNVMYVFHFYAASHLEDRRDIVEEASAQLPIFITEFGTQSYTGDGENDFQSSEEWLSLLEEKKISWVNWNFSDDFRSGAVWNTGICPEGPWTESSMKEAGKWIWNKMKTEDDFNDETSARQTVSPKVAPLLITRFGRGIEIEFSSSGPHEIDLLSITGEKQLHIHGHSQRTLFLDTSRLLRGTYILALNNNSYRKLLFIH